MPCEIIISKDTSKGCTTEFTDMERDRLISQYKDSPQLKGFIASYTNQLLGDGGLLKTWQDMSIFLCIDKAAGKWLDIIGIIVGIDRYVKNGIAIDYFGYKNDPNSDSFGLIGNPDVGGYWIYEGQPLSGGINMDDTSYRLAIRGKIAKNFYDGTLNKTIEILQMVFLVPCMVFDLTGDYTIYIGKQLDQLERSLLTDNELLPKILGFKANIDYGPLPYFGFQGVPCAEGFDMGSLSGELT
ncbi:MAG: hypothetical protein DRH08_07860 [Deltaproteobacteria bacterium]|nr:MAG: hypothetical protein DRH08_07860 [Deltaproteobacteria bacterium]